MFNISNFLINKRITQGAESRLTNKGFLERELDKWLTSQERRMMLDGENYYNGDHDILFKTRDVYDPKTGQKVPLQNLPNSKVVDNQYRKLVNQKVNYLMGNPFTITSDNEVYAELLNNMFNARMRRRLKNTLGDAYNGGKAWWFFGYDENGEVCIRRFPAYEVKAFWADSEHTILESAIRIYTVLAYEGDTEKKIQKVEVYTNDGIDFFERGDRGTLYSVEPYHQDYLTLSLDDNETGFNWSRIPLICFKANESETAMIKACKSLQDGINQIESAFEDNMLEDSRNTILILVNYDGQDLSEFRTNLARYGAIKVRSGEGGGDVRALRVEVNADNYKAILKLFKDALIENAMAYDAKDDRLNGTPNRMNIQSMYSDIDLDANNIEVEFQAALEELLWFVNCDFYNRGLGNFEGVKAKFTFNRDTMVNETEIINDIKNSIGIVSNRTLLENHPYVVNVDDELQRLADERELDDFGFGDVDE